MLHDKCFATSPLGNNSVEATASGHAAVDDATPRGVPLEFDPSTQQWVAKLSKINQEDEEVSLDVSQQSAEDQSFLRAVGFQQ